MYNIGDSFVNYEIENGCYIYNSKKYRDCGLILEIEDDGRYLCACLNSFNGCEIKSIKEKYLIPHFNEDCLRVFKIRFLNFMD